RVLLHAVRRARRVGRAGGVDPRAAPVSTTGRRRLRPCWRARPRGSNAAAALLATIALAMAVAGCAGSGEPVERSTTSSIATDPGGSAGSPASTASTGATASTGTPKVGSTVAAELDQPIAMVPRPGDDDHVWVAERPGRIRRLRLVD